MRVFSKFPEKNKCVKNETNILMFACTVVLYKYMKSLMNDTGFVRVMESWKSHGFLFCKIKAFKSHGKLYFMEKSLNSHGKLLFEL
jgi:hypothetical protein